MAFFFSLFILIYVFLFMKSINIFLFGSTLCQLMDQLRPSTGNPLAFLCFSFLYWFMSSCSWKSYKFYCLGAHCVSSWSRYGLIQALQCYFLLLFFYIDLFLHVHEKPIHFRVVIPPPQPPFLHFLFQFSPCLLLLCHLPNVSNQSYHDTGID